MTGKNYESWAASYAAKVTADGNTYYYSNWKDLNKLQKSGTTTIFFSGTILDEDLIIYNTFTVHPNGEYFEPFLLAIPMNERSSQ